MTWFKVDDTFHSHPKVLATDPAALGLWVLAGAWCSANLTDGFVPDYVLPRLLPDSAVLAEKLVTSRLWRRTKGGYRFHDWSEYNPSAESVKTERDAAKERMRKLRQGRRQNHEATGHPEECSGEHQANVRENFGGSSQPRPDPTRSSSNEELQSQKTSSSGKRAAKPRRHATRIPDDFAVTPEMVAWAQQNAPDVDGRRETEKFVDYWRAASGVGATKNDWIATWRNWLRRAQEDRPARARPHVNGQLKEHNGLMLTDRNIERLQGRARFEAMDAAGIDPLALEGGAA